MTNREIENEETRTSTLKHIKESFKANLTEYEAKDFKFFLGKIMRKTTGHFNPDYVENLIKENIGD